jgi:hypothetical protein
MDIKKFNGASFTPAKSFDGLFSCLAATDFDKSTSFSAAKRQNSQDRREGVSKGTGSRWLRFPWAHVG